MKKTHTYTIFLTCLFFSTKGIYFYAFPCRGRFDLYLNKNAAASKSAQIAQLIWQDRTDSTFKYLSVATAPLDTVFYINLHAYDQLPNSTDFASVRLVVTKDKDWPTKNIVQLPSPALQGEVVDDKSTLRITFKPAAPLTGFIDTYEVFTKVGAVGDPVKEPLNGCSLPTLLNRLDPQPAITDSEDDKTMRTYSVNNTHKLDADPAFTTAIRVCRKPSEGSGYTWCIAYQTLSVCEGDSCAGTRGTAASFFLAPIVAALSLFVAAIALSNQTN